MNQIILKYGKDAKVLFERTIQKRYLFGLGNNKKIVMTGIYSIIPAVQTKHPATSNDFEITKRQVLLTTEMFALEASISAVLKEISNLTEIIQRLKKASKVCSRIISMHGNRKPDINDKRNFGIHK